MKSYPRAKGRYIRRSGSVIHLRSRPGDIEYRQDSDGLEIEGYGLRWDSQADLGFYTESFQRGAFAHTLGDVRLKIGHDQRRLALARSPDTMTVREDSTGLHFRALLDEANPEVQALASALSRGDVDGSSIGFSMRGGKFEVEVDDTDDREHYTVTRAGTLWEISAVDFPAYESSSIGRGRERFSLQREEFRLAVLGL